MSETGSETTQDVSIAPEKKLTLTEPETETVIKSEQTPTDSGIPLPVAVDIEIPATLPQSRPEMPTDRKDRITKTINELKPPTQESLSPTGILGDTDKIEGHQIDISSDGKNLYTTFKMTESHTASISNLLESKNGLGNLLVEDGQYEFKSLEGQSYKPADCWVIKVDQDTNIYVSKGYRSTTETEIDYSKPIRDEDGEIVDYQKKEKGTKKVDVRSMVGQVKVEILNATNSTISPEELQTAFDILNIPDGLEPPPENSEIEYKLARIKWHHKLDTEKEYNQLETEYRKQGTHLLANLSRQEAVPGYFTIVDKGASERYQKDGQLILIHNVYNPDNLVSTIKNGLLSSQERLKRGAHIEGLSTHTDFEGGGADNVFLRAVPKATDVEFYDEYPTLIIDSSELDRTDWYAYDEDKAGQTKPDLFATRQAPKDFFKFIRNNVDKTRFNEVMMRRGVASSKIKSILISKYGDQEQKKKDLIELLKSNGIDNINGKPIEQVVTTHKEFVADNQSDKIIDRIKRWLKI